MRRLLAVLAALLIASPVAAKTMIVVDEASWGALTEPGPAMARNNEQRQLATLRRAFDRLGVTDYTIVHPKLMKTEFLRTGVMTWNFGLAGAWAESFDAAIVVAFNGRNASATGVTFRADSLTLSNPAAASGGLPTKPVLFLLNPDVTDVGAFLNDGTTTQRCTLGTQEYCGAGSCSGSHESERCLYVPGYPEAWFQTTYTGTMVRNSTPPAGGIRTLLAARSNPNFLRWYWSYTFSSNVDSIGRYSTQSNADSMLVWERPMAHVSGAATQLYALMNDVNTTVLDTSESAEYALGVGGDVQILLFALQRLDSLAGGNVLGGNYKKIRVAAVVRGAGGQAGRAHHVGIQRADSATIKAACDSVAELRVPVTVAGDPDSMTAAEAAWWKRMGRVRFTPYARRGLDSSIAGLGNSSASAPVDVFGRYRNRNIYGPTSGDTANVYAGIAFKRNAMQDLVGRDYMSHALVPPEEDWTPKQVRRGQNTVQVDSLLWVFRLAGYRTLVTDVLPPVQTQAPSLATVGWGFLEGPRRIAFGDQAGESFMISGHNGYRVGGSQFLMYGPTDSTAFGSPWGNNLGGHGAIVWRGFIGGNERDETMNGKGTNAGAAAGVTTTQAAAIYTPQLGSVLMLGASEFGAAGSARCHDFPGYWQLKHFVHATRAINRMGYNQRALMEWVFPEDL